MNVTKKEPRTPMSSPTKYQKSRARLFQRNSEYRDNTLFGYSLPAQLRVPATDPIIRNIQDIENRIQKRQRDIEEKDANPSPTKSSKRAEEAAQLSKLQESQFSDIIQKHNESREFLVQSKKSQTFQEINSNFKGEMRRLNRSQSYQTLRSTLFDSKSEKVCNDYTSSSTTETWMDLTWSLLTRVMESRLPLALNREEEESLIQSDWAAIIRYQQYGHIGPFSKENPAWCPVSRNYNFETGVSTSHFFPKYLGRTEASKIFGERPEDGHYTLWNPGNGLLTCQSVEKQIEKGKIAFMPISPLTHPIEYRLVIIDPTIRDDTIVTDLGKDKPKTWSELENYDKLEFRKEGRPDPRYVYFHFAISLIRMYHRGQFSHDDLKGWFGCWSTLFSSGHYGSKDGWYDRSILRHMARYLGDEKGLLHVLFPSVQDAGTPEHEAVKSAGKLAAFVLSEPDDDHEVFAVSVETTDTEED